jgi:ADP-ribose pyrophosphatase YjhB (NUDIX family)
MALTVAKHDIQKYILSKLTYTQEARFRDLKPPKVATNLFSYHLKLLEKADMVEHTDEGGYTLSLLGLNYVDRLNDEGEFAYQQAKMVTMYVIQNSDGGILLEHRTKQPYINTWTLPNRKLSIDDEPLHEAAMSEVRQRFGLKYANLRHAGDCYIRVDREEAPITVTFAHIFAFESDDIVSATDQRWVHPRQLHTVTLAPAVEQIVARTFFRDPFYFEEFEHNW